MSDRYEWCPLRMVDLWWSAWKNIWLFIGAECGWRQNLFDMGRCTHKTEWEFQAADDVGIPGHRTWWHQSYGLKESA